MKQPKIIDSTRAFDSALAGEADAARYQLHLFITGNTPKCTRAIKNIRAICDEHLSGQYELEVVDIYQHPEQARPDQIIVTPTLVKKLPLPSRRMIGDLSDLERVLRGLDIVRGPMPGMASENQHDT